MTDQETQAPAAAPEPPRFVGDRPRFKAIPLEWPIAYGGKEYSEIHLVRLTAKDVADYIDSFKDRDPNEAVVLPIFRDADGADIPPAVLDALDEGDRFEIDQAAVDFLPRRFRAIQESGSGPADGDNTAPSSSA